MAEQPGTLPSCSSDAQDAQRQGIHDAFVKGAAGRLPRPHQVEAVGALLNAMHADCHSPSPTNYLLQHSTGSGKSLTIALLASQLIGFRDAMGRTFHLVLIVNDRLQLDKQLSDTLTRFMSALGFSDSAVHRAGSAAELAGFISAPSSQPNRPVVVLTTLQKLTACWAAGRGAKHGPKRARGMHAPGRIAVLADEAHRSHGQGSTSLIHEMLAAAQLHPNDQGSPGPGAAAALPRDGDATLAAARAQAEATQAQQRPGAAPSASNGLKGTLQPRWLTYVGFTATPSPRALQMFGVARSLRCDALGLEMSDDEGAPGSEGLQGEPVLEYAPFHAYTMEQATTDGHVVHVLRNFTSVAPQLQITGLSKAGDSMGAEHSSSNRPATPHPDATLLQEAALIDAAYCSQDVVARKAAFVAEGFVGMWEEAAQQGFTQIRGMVVVRSRRHVVWWVRHLRAALAGNHRWAALLRGRAETASPAMSGPAVYGAFSGSLALPQSEAQALEEQLEEEATQQGSQDNGRGTRMRTVVNAGGVSQRQPVLPRRRANPWDAALAHLGDGEGHNCAPDSANTGRCRRPAAPYGPVTTGTAPADEVLPPDADRQRGVLVRSSSSSRSSLTAPGTGSVPRTRRSAGGGSASPLPPPDPTDADDGPSSASDAGEAATDDPGSWSSPGGNVSGGMSDTSSMHGSLLSEEDSDRSSAESGPDASNDDVPLAQLGKRRRRGAVNTVHDVQPRPAPARSRRRAGRDVRSGAVDDDAGAVSDEGDAAADGADAEMVALTEEAINGGRGADHRAARLLVCCNKFETGYDDPRLGALFIDRPLLGAKAVQVLGRLNRCAPELRKSDSLVWVVDFANTVGGLQEAVGQFWGITTHRTGRAAQRMRLEARLDHCVSQLLDALQPAAARAAVAAALAAARAGGGDPAAAARGLGGVAAGALGSLNAVGAAALIARMPGDAREDAAASLAAYVTTCQDLGREKPELPLAWASCVHTELGKLLKAKGRVSGDGAGHAEEPQDPGGSDAGGGVDADAHPDIKVQCELVERFRGSVTLAARSGAPLPSRRIPRPPPGSSLADVRTMSADAQARKGRPLRQVIAAANAALSASLGTAAAAQDHVARLGALCTHLRQATGAAAAPAPDPALPGAAVAATSAEDAVMAAGLLRRLLMWPVTPALLRETGAGKLVARLRKHSNAQVAQLAEEVTAMWKEAVTAPQPAPAPAAPVAPPLPRSRSSPAPPPAAVVEDVRAKAREMLAAALADHVKAVAASHDGTEPRPPVRGAPPDAQRLRRLACDVEAAVHAASSRAAVPKAEYRARLRLLVPGLRLVDGVAPRLLAGQLPPSALATLESHALASAAVRKQAEEAARRRAEAEERWERAVGGGAMGGGSFITNDVKCPACGSSQAQVHTVMSGGTYAQERTQIQKYVCQQCNHTWRSDD